MLYLATDHRGLKLKEKLKVWLTAKKVAFEDLGAHEYDPEDDYPKVAQQLAARVGEHPQNRGVVFCGSGVGVCIACNKITGIRCGLGFNHHQVTAATTDDHLNVLAIAADFTNPFKTFQLVKRFLATSPSSEPRHLRRVEQVKVLEELR